MLGLNQSFLSQVRGLILAPNRGGLSSYRCANKCPPVKGQRRSLEQGGSKFLSWHRIRRESELNDLYSAGLGEYSSLQCPSQHFCSEQPEANTETNTNNAIYTATFFIQNSPYLKFHNRFSLRPIFIFGQCVLSVITEYFNLFLC